MIQERLDPDRPDAFDEIESDPITFIHSDFAIRVLPQARVTGRQRTFLHEYLPGVLGIDQSRDEVDRHLTLQAHPHPG